MAVKSSYAKMGVRAKEELVNRVAQLGKEAIDYAFKQGFRSKPRKIEDENYRKWLIRKGKDPNKAWDDISYNLRDSIGSAVYVNGELREDTIRYANETPQSKGKDNDEDNRSGREALMDYFRKIHPNRGKNDITLICVAAMYYANLLEKGWHGGGYKIKVISSAADYVKRNWERTVDGVYKSLKIKKPASRVIRGDIQPLKDSGFYG